MTRIGIRELRQNASEWIRRAESGERIEVTRRGDVVAVIGPALSENVLARLRQAGRLRAATFAGPLPAPAPASRSASEMLAELRADER